MNDNNNDNVLLQEWQSMMTATCYEGGKTMMTSLIIIKIKFICFKEDEIGGSYVQSHARSRARSYDHKSRDYGVTKSYLLLYFFYYIPYIILFSLYSFFYFIKRLFK